MKYIISESRLHEIITDYLDTFIQHKAVSHLSNYIVISQQNQGDDEIWADYMEYDYVDGRLWINREFLSNITDLFFKDKDDAKKFIANYFENKFGAEVKFVES